MTVVVSELSDDGSMADMRRFLSVEAIFSGDDGSEELPVRCDCRGRVLVSVGDSLMRRVLCGEAVMEMRFTDGNGRVRTAAICGCFDRCF